MRTITLLVASLLLTANVAKANETKCFNVSTTINRFSFDEPISFTERGIAFFVFADGSFDFNTRPYDSQGTFYYKSAGKRGENTATDRMMPNYGVAIERDNFGRIRRVGNTFINYDFRDRVSRIGSVFMGYNRFALSQVGGLQIVYGRNGEIVDMFGSVKGYCNDGYAYNNYNYENEYNNNNHYQNYNNNSNSYYYYKTDGSRSRIEGENK